MMAQTQDHGRRDAIICLALASLVLLLYAQAARFDFIQFDDPRYVTENPRVLAGLNGSNVGWAFSTFYFANWHPLTWLSHMTDVSMYGVNPAGHHLNNILFHAINAMLVYVALSALMK